MTQYKGQLEGFPREVVEWMLDQQEAQGNKRDVSVFEENSARCKSLDGFDWYDTKEGVGFCEEVIDQENFPLFFERYPKKSEPIESKITGLDTSDLKEGESIHLSDFGGIKTLKPEPSYIEVVTQIVCVIISSNFYTSKENLVTESISIADEIFKQCNK